MEASQQEPPPTDDVALISSPAAAASSSSSAAPTAPDLDLPPPAPPPAPPSAPPSEEVPSAGDKRKAVEATPPIIFKKPSLPAPQREPSFSPAKVDFLRPPLLTVDTSIIVGESGIGDDVVQIAPPTPANVRSKQRTDLHVAVVAGDVGEATKLIEDFGHTINPQEEHGFTPLMSAAVVSDAAPRQALIALLLRHQADVLRQDNDGYTALHWAAATGHDDVLPALLEAGASLSQRCKSGETALHRAARLGKIECVKLLTSAGGLGALTSLNKSLHTPLDVAGKLDAAGKGGRGRVDEAKRAASRRAMLELHPSLRTLVLHHPDCMLHLTGDWHQEHPLRLEAILEALHAATPSNGSGSGGSGGNGGGGANGSGSAADGGNGVVPHERARRDSPSSSGGGGGSSGSSSRALGSTSAYTLPRWEWSERHDFEQATVEELGRVHDTNYVSVVAQASSRMAINPPASPVPLTPMVQQARGAARNALKDPTTSDTRLSSGSYAAATRAAGAVIAAIDEVLAGNCRNALCLVRPPGHHAGIRGLIPGSVSCGFCVFNSVMVGAAHALRQALAPPPPPPQPPPPAAGGGAGAAAGAAAAGAAAEAAGFAAAPRVWPRVAIIDFDVHHGDGTDEILRKLTQSLPPNALFFASIHLFDRGDANFGPFYPESGEGDSLQHNIINVALTPMWRGKPTAAGRGRGGGPSSPRLCGCGRAEWRQAFSTRIIPCLRAFAPDLILLSAGFDGGCGDIGNCKQDKKEKYHHGLDLTPTDFEWATQQMLGVAAVCCPGRVVSVLEGGYGAFEFSKESASGWAISRSQLAENVAAHLSALAGVKCPD